VAGYDYKKHIRKSSRTTRKRAEPTTIEPLTLDDFPEGYQDNAEVKSILERVWTENSDPILITGKAGTGKSTLVNFIRFFGNVPNTVVVAPTGVAALNVQGQTIHSFFRLPLQIIDEEALINQRRNKIWAKIELVIIDEISMVRADLLDGIDMVLRKAQDPDIPFGGVKMIFVGDFFQLAPVAPPREAEMLMKMGYAGPYAYHAKVFEQVYLEYIELKEVHRQTQPEFLEILSNIRLGQNIRDSLRTLNEQCCEEHRAQAIPLLLTATNKIASRYNDEGLEDLASPLKTYEGLIRGKFNINRVPAPKHLALKLGARVMAVKNDTQGRWVNGSIGTVVKLEEKAVSVKFDKTGKTGRLEPVKWESIRYSWNETENKTIAKVAATYQQIPLILSWAVTIHKAQGLTLDDVRIDLGHGAFAPGQTYVALSRARTIEGLSFNSELYEEDIEVEDRHFDFLSNINAKKAPRELTSVAQVKSRQPKRTNLADVNIEVRDWRPFTDSNPSIPIFELEKMHSGLSEYIFSDFEYFISIDYEARGRGLTKYDIKAYHIVFLSGSNEWFLQAFSYETSKVQLFKFSSIRKLYDRNRNIEVDDNIDSYLLNLGKLETGSGAPVL